MDIQKLESLVPEVEDEQPLYAKEYLEKYGKDALHAYAPYTRLEIHRIMEADE